MDYEITAEQFEELVESQRKLLEKKTDNTFRKLLPEYSKLARKPKWLYHGTYPNISLYMDIGVNPEWWDEKTFWEKKSFRDEMEMFGENLFVGMLGNLNVEFGGALVIPLEVL